MTATAAAGIRCATRRALGGEGPLLSTYQWFINTAGFNFLFGGVARLHLPPCLTYSSSILIDQYDTLKVSRALFSARSTTEHAQNTQRLLILCLQKRQLWLPGSSSLNLILQQNCKTWGGTDEKLNELSPTEQSWGFNFSHFGELTCHFLHRVKCSVFHLVCVLLMHFYSD